MPPTPSPVPIDVFVHTGPPDWWQVFAALSPLAVLLAAAIGAFMAWRTLQQKSAADGRAQWWNMTRWALDAVYSGDRKIGTSGMKVLQALAYSTLAGPAELAVLEAAWQNPLKRARQRLEQGKGSLRDEVNVGARRDDQSAGAVLSRESDADERVFEIAAAQLRIVTDDRLRNDTPEWVKELAKASPQASEEDG